ncbi:MAG: hypothetical protein M1822_000209 [Bathelium mastoideum]|nr:MAG: hypothetical protein M1822_000209 [Bathelium mastoideum]
MTEGIVSGHSPAAGDTLAAHEVTNGATSSKPDVPPLGELRSDAGSAPRDFTTSRQYLQRSEFSTMSVLSHASVPPPGSILTGKQEHYLKRELISQQVKNEVSELASTTALQRFGAPFRSDAGEVPPEDSELPILRYIFVHHIRNFPFLDQAREKEFWQDKLQVFLESFASKHISSSEDRLEETKRRKLAMKAEKLVELMMVSGLPTASGYEERIRFAEMEVVDRGANEQGLVVNLPQGHEINGWDVNVAGVRTASVKRHVRHHQHSEFILRVKRGGKPEIYVGRRFGDFARMHKRLRLELPGKVLPPLPRKNKSHSFWTAADDDAESISSFDTQDTRSLATNESTVSGGLRSYLPFMGGHRRTVSTTSPKTSPRPSLDDRPQERVILHREEQRVSLRAFLRTFLQNEQIAQSNAMSEFLTANPITPNEDEQQDIRWRMEMDEKRIEEQRQFFEIARQRAKELDVHMEKFRRDVVESNGLSKLFKEIRTKNTIQELSPEYQKFAEWLRIEVAATLYHLFLAEDNSPELFAQAKRIHSLIPYGMLKNVIRIANPAAVMSGVLDLFLAQPFGARSLMQRVLAMAIGDGIRSLQKSIDSLHPKIDDPRFCEKIQAYTNAEESIKIAIREEAMADGVDLVVAIMRSEELGAELAPKETETIVNAFVAWNNAVENVDDQMKQGAELYAYLKQLLKLYTRQRDKIMMQKMIEEPTTLQLFRDLFTIFYEPLVRVYKSANVYSSVTDFADFADDAVRVIEAAQRQDVAADPNQTVQAFIDLCARHEHNFYKFVHEVHCHDNGLFDQLMGWLDGILAFLRHGPRSGKKLDMNALVRDAVGAGDVPQDMIVRDANALIRWQTARKKWHHAKTRQKMAAEGTGAGPATANGVVANGADLPGAAPGGLANAFHAADFGLNETDLQELDLDGSGAEDDSSSDDDDPEDAAGGLDPIAAERRRRRKRQDHLRRSAGEPAKPPVEEELHLLHPRFLNMLRRVLAE